MLGGARTTEEKPSKGQPPIGDLCTPLAKATPHPIGGGGYMLPNVNRGRCTGAPWSETTLAWPRSSCTRCIARSIRVVFRSHRSQIRSTLSPLHKQPPRRENKDRQTPIARRGGCSNLDHTPMLVLRPRQTRGCNKRIAQKLGLGVGGVHECLTEGRTVGTTAGFLHWDVVHPLKDELSLRSGKYPKDGAKAMKGNLHKRDTEFVLVHMVALFSSSHVRVHHRSLRRSKRGRRCHLCGELAAHGRQLSFSVVKTVHAWLVQPREGR